ncbi:cytoskeletal protein RodZ [Sporotomaculum syntrophicum]|uniref:Cytoskeletal protein RodZ n=1 Tax=Sporotomaculum syntrophicum TaxID=182264 RepID=A0A9D2WND0_9FIRM|nr:helix-turn-helix domain-containing protein [Sporotomaculum syntrophicum]KAF1084600.1 cytoskeletal protein RodZ [Sporotomaculum syntrophicum]
MSIGEELRQARQQMGASLKDVENETKIRTKYINAMENDAFDVLPEKVYVKGFLRTYARFLGLDGDTLVTQYEEQFRPRLAAQKAGVTTRYSKPAIRWKGFAIAVLALVVLALIYRGGFVLGNLSDDIADIGQQSGTSNQYSVDEHKGQAPKTDQETKTVNMVLQVVGGESWIKIAVDNKYVFEGTLGPNHVRQFTGREKIWVKFGNAGVVNVKVNDQDYGFLDGPGQVVTRTFTKDDGQQTAGG